MKTSKTGPRLKKPGGEGLLRASPFLLPSLIGLAIFYLAPMVVSIFISLTDWNGLDRLFADGFMQEHFIGLDNYKAILTSQEFWKVLKNTLTYIVLYLPLMMAVSLAVASLLSQQRRGVGVFRVLYYIPVLTSWVAASLIWKSILAPQYGAMNNILAFFGIEGPGWLLDEKWAMPAIVLVSVWKDMGFFGLILLSGMVGINRTYYEAAEIDGAGACGLQRLESLVTSYDIGLKPCTAGRAGRHARELLCRQIGGFLFLVGFLRPYICLALFPRVKQRALVRFR